MRRGYFGIGIYQTKNAMNVGTLWRSAMNFGASFIFTVGHRYKHQRSDTVKAFRNVPFYQYADFEAFNCARPKECPLIAVEQSAESRDLREFSHPDRAIYLLGAEDDGIPEDILKKCQGVVFVPTPLCINVAVAGSIVMYDRSAKIAPGQARLAA